MEKKALQINGIPSMHILHPRADQRIGFCRGLMEIAVGMVQVPENPARFGVYPAHKRFHRPAIRQHSRCFDRQKRWNSMKIAFSTLGCPGWSWDEIFATAI